MDAVLGYIKSLGECPVDFQVPPIIDMKRLCRLRSSDKPSWYFGAHDQDSHRPFGPVGGCPVITSWPSLCVMTFFFGLLYIYYIHAVWKCQWISSVHKTQDGRRRQNLSMQVAPRAQKLPPPEYIQAAARNRLRQVCLKAAANAIHTWGMRKKPNDLSMVKVKVIFKESGLTLHDLGMKMGYDAATARQSAFQFMKSGDPRISMLRRFAKAMGIPLEDLLAEKKEKPTPSDPVSPG
jgi:hypothetical protein